MTEIVGLLGWLGFLISVIQQFSIVEFFLHRFIRENFLELIVFDHCNGIGIYIL